MSRLKHGLTYSDALAGSILFHAAPIALLAYGIWSGRGSSRIVAAIFALAVIWTAVTLIFRCAHCGKSVFFYDPLGGESLSRVYVSWFYRVTPEATCSRCGTELAR